MSRRRLDRVSKILRSEPPWSLLYNHGRVTWAQIRQNGGLSLPFVWTTTRYLKPYIGHSLTHGERRDIVMTQARHLREHARRSLFLELLRPRQPLWRSAERCYSIWLSADRSGHLEGDFDLTFKLDGAAIYTLSFSIGPNLADPAAGDVAMLVGRVQGERGRLEDIRLATKTLNGISPAALLVSAAEGIALALNLSHICGVSGAEQLSRQRPRAEYFDYDSFWESLSGRRIGGWYQFDAPFPHMPTSQTATHHRRRTRQRRLFKDAVRQEVRAAFAERFARPYGAPPPAVDRIPSWARWAQQWIRPSVGPVAALAFATFYWIWPSDLLPDTTRYGRIDDVAIALLCAILCYRTVAVRRARSRRAL